jgi:hypothetical protein
LLALLLPLDLSWRGACRSWRRVVCASAVDASALMIAAATAAQIANSAKVATCENMQKVRLDHTQALLYLPIVLLSPLHPHSMRLLRSRPIPSMSAPPTVASRHVRPVALSCAHNLPQ